MTERCEPKPTDRGTQQQRIRVTTPEQFARKHTCSVEQAILASEKCKQLIGNGDYSLDIASSILEYGFFPKPNDIQTLFSRLDEQISKKQSSKNQSAAPTFNGNLLEAV